jgi:serine protease Do
MDQIALLDATERYLRGEMNEEERLMFEDLRTTSPEVDQFVVEHLFFMGQLDRYADLKLYRANIYDVHHTLKETGDINELKPVEQASIVQLWNKYRRTIAVAASIAGITALLISGITLFLSPKAPVKDLEELRRKVNKLEVRTNTQDVQINDVKKKVNPNATITFGGTSFVIDSRGYLLTSAHVVENAAQVFVQNTKGEDFKARIVYTDKAKDLAVLKIEDEDFKNLGALPYAFRRSGTDLAEPVFTLGFPKDEIVYGEGYLSALTGLKGDTMSSQITISANPGNSGGPVLNKNGELIGILNARQTSADGVVFAIKTKHILHTLEDLKRTDTNFASMKIPATSTLRGLERTKQVEKMSECVYMVKVVM